LLMENLWSDNAKRPGERHNGSRSFLANRKLKKASDFSSLSGGEALSHVKPRRERERRLRKLGSKETRKGKGKKR